MMNSVATLPLGPPFSSSKTIPTSKFSVANSTSEKWNWCLVSKVSAFHLKCWEWTKNWWIDCIVGNTVMKSLFRTSNPLSTRNLVWTKIRLTLCQKGLFSQGWLSNSHFSVEFEFWRPRSIMWKIIFQKIIFVWRAAIEIVWTTYKHQKSECFREKPASILT